MILYDYDGWLYLGDDLSLKHTVDFTKSMGKWDAEHVAWKFPPLYQCVLDIQTEFPEAVANSESALVQELFTYRFGFEEKNIDFTKYPYLRPYQRDAVSFLVNSPTKAGLLGLSPGLGKTLTSLVAADIIGAKHILVVCPKILISSWLGEIKKWTEFSAKSAWSSGPDTSFEGIQIVNYETLTGQYKDLWKGSKWDILIIDESIMIKNLRANSPKSSNRARAVFALRKNSKIIWELSGSPVSKYLDDLFGQFRVLLPKIFTSYWRFAEKHCILERNIWDTSGGYGGQVIGSLHSINARERFKDLLLTAHMDEVAKHIPEYIFVDAPVILSDAQQRKYDKLETKLLKKMETAELSDIPDLQEALDAQAFLAEEAVIKTKTDYVLTILREEIYDLPMLIWTYHRDVADSLYASLQKTKYKVARVYGAMADSDALIEAYKNGEYDILILSIALGKYGLTLINTKTIISYEKTYDADAMYQSSFRTRREGLQHRPVYINLYFKDSIEEAFVDNLTGKFNSIAKVTGARQEMLMRLIRP